MHFWGILPLGIFRDAGESIDDTDIAAKTAKKDVFQRGEPVMPRFLWGDGKL